MLPEQFEEGDTVRLGNRHGIPFGTPSQRRILWRVTSADWRTSSGMEGPCVMIERMETPHSMMHISIDVLIPSTVLDLMAARIDEKEALTRE